MEQLIVQAVEKEVEDARSGEISVTDHRNDLHEWPAIAGLLDEAGRTLKERYGNLIPRQALIDEVLTRHRYKPDSVIPTDYCYNSINADPISCQHCLFEVVKKGSASYFRHLGPNFPYTGDVFWKGHPVGRWTNGSLYLHKDPRHA